MTTREILSDEHWEAMIRSDFKDHVAIESRWSDHIGDGVTIEWKKPGTNIYRIVYMMRGGLLICYGDCGEAVYSWGGVPGGLTPQWLSNLHLSYFASKCEASDDYRNSHRGMEWDREKAEAAIRARVVEYSEDEDWAAKFSNITGYEYEEAAWSDESAGRFASEYGIEPEDLYDSGWTVSGTVRRHFYGIKMATEYLTKARGNSDES